MPLLGKGGVAAPLIKMSLRVHPSVAKEGSGSIQLLAQANAG